MQLARASTRSVVALLLGVVAVAGCAPEATSEDAPAANAPAAAARPGRFTRMHLDPQQLTHHKTLRVDAQGKLVHGCDDKARAAEPGRP